MFLCLFIPLLHAVDPTVFSEGRVQVPLEKEKKPSVAATLLEDLASVRTLPESLDYPALPPEELRAFSEYLDGLAQDLRVPGYALLILQGKDTGLEHCYGLRRVTEIPPVDPNTVFNIGPPTAAFSSLLAATMDGEDGFSYQKLARRIWPRFRMSDSRSADQVDLYQLFTMTAGVPSYTDRILDPAWARPEDVFEVIAQAPVIAPPGRLFEPSTVSSAAAGYLTGIAEHKGEDFYTAYTKAMRTRLIEPLGMTTATFSREKAEAGANIASPHVRKGSGYDPAKRWEPQVNALAPAIGLKASLRDMGRWLTAELLAGETAEGKRLARPISVRQRWQPARAQNSQSYGMGWSRQYYQGVEIIASMGSYDRQSAAIGILPAYRTGFVVLVNCDGEEANRIMQEVALGTAEMFRAMLAEENTPGKPSPENTPEPSEATPSTEP